tara:strand:+ start:8651 stop:9562 length:912 start_codon:yes stop_codon:yes gene_type:complete
MKRPISLQEGDTIAILAPAGIIKNTASIHEASELAKSWGLYVVLGKHVFTKNNHFAGSDSQRLEDFQEALDDTSIKAIWCARGGYGTVRIVDDLDFSVFQKNPKWIVGYSDITVLHNHVHSLGIETLHAMMPVNMEFSEDSRKESVSTFKKALFGEEITYSILSTIYNITGKASGQLVGGNLTILENLLGTPSALDTSNKILFIEEIGEYKYHIDRLLRALDRNGSFKNCNGLVIGDMTRIKSNNPAFGQNIEAVILAIVAKYNFPVLFDFPAGHEPENRALYLGRNITLDVTASSGSIHFID